MQAVQVQPEEADRRMARCLVMGAEPAHEVEHIRVAPHPLGESLEAGECFRRVTVRRQAVDVSMDPVGVRPVTLDRHRSEAVVPDQTLGDLPPDAVEVMGAMGGLAQQDTARIPAQGEQWIEVIPAAAQWPGVLPQRGEGRVSSSHGPPPRAVFPRPA